MEVKVVVVVSWLSGKRKTCGGVVCAEEKQCGMFETLSEGRREKEGYGIRD